MVVQPQRQAFILGGCFDHGQQEWQGPRPMPTISSGEQTSGELHGTLSERSQRSHFRAFSHVRGTVMICSGRTLCPHAG
jgi:hypothetical protein